MGEAEVAVCVCTCVCACVLFQLPRRSAAFITALWGKSWDETVQATKKRRLKSYEEVELVVLPGNDVNRQ